MNDKIDAVSSAMSGVIKFRGDRIKALVLQQIRRDMNRLWVEALKKA